MELIIIAAVAENNVIGAEGKIPWNIPKDMKRFYELTKNHPVIMGRKTYESIGKPLPERLNIVLTKQSNFNPEGVCIAGSLEEAIAKSKDNLGEIDGSKVYILGGQQVYKQTLLLADKLEITHVHRKVKGDTYFPELDLKEWTVQKEINNEGYSFISYMRCKK